MALKTKTLTANGAKGHHKFTLSVSENSTSVSNNTSSLSFSFVLSPIQTSWNWEQWGSSISYTVNINGNKYTGTIPAYDGYSSVTLKSGSLSVGHNSDGSKSISISFSVTDGAGQYYTCGNASSSGTMTLTTIPRASSFGTISGNTIGSNMTVNINRNSSSFTHQLWYKLGNSKWYDLGTGIGTSKKFTISNDLLSQLPSATSGTLQLCVRTYNGSTQIGSDVYKNVTVYVNSNVVPTMGIITLTPQTYSKLIQGKNKLNISVSGCSAGTGSSIKSYTFSGPGISTTITGTSVTSGVISNTGTLTYTVTVTDNRGRKASGTQTITCYSYSPPYIRLFNAYRSDSSGKANSKGTHLTCVVNSGDIVYSLAGNTNNITVKIFYRKGTGSWTSVTALSNSTEISLTKIVGSIDASSTYSVYATISDKYGGSSTYSTITIFGESRVLNISKDGTCIAIGKMAEDKELLDVKWPIISRKPEQTMQNLSYRGTNLISSTTKDTVANWNNQGNLATTFYTQTGQINGQPSQYGFLLNLTTGPGGQEAHQIWLAQNHGDMLHRGGNSSGMATQWRRVLDAANYTTYVSPKPTTLYSSTSGNIGTVTLSESAANFTYLEIFYIDNNSRQPNSVKVYSPNGKYVTLCCVEPSTANAQPRVYIRTSGWTISGSTMVVGWSDPAGKNRGVYAQIYQHAGGTNIDISITENYYIKIIRVLGYK